MIVNEPMNLFHSYNLTNISIAEEWVLFSQDDQCEVRSKCRTALEGWLWASVSQCARLLVYNVRRQSSFYRRGTRPLFISQSNTSHIGKPRLAGTAEAELRSLTDFWIRNLQAQQQPKDDLFFDLEIETLGKGKGIVFESLVYTWVCGTVGKWEAFSPWAGFCTDV